MISKTKRLKIVGRVINIIDISNKQKTSKTET